MIIKVWLCYWYDELEVRPDKIDILFEEPSLEQRASYHKIVPKTYRRIEEMNMLAERV